MTHYLNILCWNCCLAAVFAIVLTVAQRFRFLRNRPQVCHALWLLVLLKLVMPPLFTVPVSLHAANTNQAAESASDVGTVPGNPVGMPKLAVDVTKEAVGDFQRSTLLETVGHYCTLKNAVILWGSVSLLLLALTVRASLQIGRLLRETNPAQDWIQHIARQSAEQMGLRSFPSILIVDAKISPFLWWSLRGPIIVVPGPLLEEVGAESVSLILRHELAHFARRDHLTNSFASGVAIVFWWNPVVWWARRELREFQEQCCDSTVLALDVNQRVRYAETLLAAVDYVASGGAKCPSPQTTFGDSQSLKRRIEMIASHKPTSGAMRTQLLSLLAAAVMLPLGMASAEDFQDLEALERRLSEEVAAGELSPEMKQVMMALVRNSKYFDKEKSEVDREAESRKHTELRIRENKKAVELGRLSREEGARPDLEALERRLSVEVAAGELSPEMKQVMMDTVRNYFDKEKSEVDWEAESRKHTERQVREIEEAVVRGIFSREEGARLIKAMERVAHPESAHNQHDSETRRRGDITIERGPDGRVHVSGLSAEEAALDLRGSWIIRHGDHGEVVEVITDETREAQSGDLRGFHRGLFRDHHGEDVEVTFYETREALPGDRDEVEEIGAHRTEVLKRQYLKRQYMIIAEKIKAAVEEGKLSEDAAEEKLLEVRQKLLEVRQKLFGGEKKDDRSTPNDRRERLRELQEHFRAAVKAGAMSEEQAEKELNALRKGTANRLKRGDQAHDGRRRYQEIERRLKTDVKNGSIPAEDAEEMLLEMRRKMFGGGKKDDRSAPSSRREPLRGVEEQIRAAVKAGIISEEQAEADLNVLRKGMANRLKRGDQARDGSRGYQEIERRLKAAVESGSMPAEDAEKMLIEIRRKLSAADE